MADQEIKTSIDALVAYLREHGETNVTSLSAALGAGEPTIIEWANILERANALKISYKAGKMYLSPLTITTEQIDTLKQNTEAQKSDISTDVQSQMAIMSQVSLQLDSMNKSMDSIEKLFKERYKDIKSVLDKLNGMESAIDNSYAKIRGKKKEADAMQAELQKEIQTIQQHATRLETFSLDTNNARRIIDDIKAKVTAYGRSLNEANEEIHQIISRHRDYVIGLRSSITEETRQLGEIVKVEERQVEEYERLAKSYRLNAKKTVEKIDRESARMLDDVAKDKDEIGRYTGAADSSLTAFKTKIADIKKEFGAAAELNDKISGIRKELGDISTKKAQLEKGLAEVANELKALDALSGPRLMEKSDRLNALEKRTKELSSVTKDIKDEADRTSTEARSLGKK
ncbi:MAG: hypothetical protein KGI00_04455 [Candidatus Micrarchaeota archaeon]|nr:hypothetical protein [Candidatus Micrarchaeota archaeon]MDE1824060.1 hypothetical protein [Candidatus Micrarchaeota archaeon]MDE1849951.1 hypothetical protein [Candidatus Micrarchaeota archaeon]